MNEIKGPSVLATLAALVVCGALAAPAYAWSWPWAKPAAAPTATSTAPASSTAATTPKNAASAKPAESKPMAAHSAKADSKMMAKVLGMVESVDAAGDRLVLKTKAGKSESFTLAKSSLIFEHHRKLTLSALKAGERVSVHYHANDNKAMRVYVLGEKKA